MSAQALEALTMANSVRMEGAAHRRDVATLSRADGLLAVAELLRCPPSAIQRMRVGHLLTSIERVGVHQAAKLLAAAHIDHPHQPVGPSFGQKTALKPLTSRQRAHLILQLRIKAGV